jgi:hypothetical protein
MLLLSHFLISVEGFGVREQQINIAQAQVQAMILQLDSLLICLCLLSSWAVLPIARCLRSERKR